MAESGSEPRSPDCQAQGSLLSTPAASPLGSHTSVSEQRSADLQISLLLEARAVFLCAQIEEALPAPPKAASFVCYQAAKTGAFGGPRTYGSDPVEREVGSGS